MCIQPVDEQLQSLNFSTERLGGCTVFEGAAGAATSDRRQTQTRKGKEGRGEAKRGGREGWSGYLPVPAASRPECTVAMKKNQQERYMLVVKLLQSSSVPTMISWECGRVGGLDVEVGG